VALWETELIHLWVEKVKLLRLYILSYFDFGKPIARLTEEEN